MTEPSGRVFAAMAAALPATSPATVLVPAAVLSFAPSEQAARASSATGAIRDIFIIILLLW